MTRDTQPLTEAAIRSRIKRVDSREKALVFIQANEHWLDEWRCNENNRKLIMIIAIAILKLSNRYPGIYLEAITDDKGITLTTGTLEEVKRLLDTEGN